MYVLLLRIITLYMNYVNTGVFKFLFKKISYTSILHSLYILQKLKFRSLDIYYS
jgi:hypothetical protein